MPYFVFKCFHCGNEEERSMTFQETEKRVVLCAKCKKPKRRIIAKTSFILKGDCWAKDGYK